MDKINLLVSNIILVLILFVWKINSDLKVGQECLPNIKHPKYGNSCRIGCENCSHFSPDPNCRTDTRAPTDEKFCMPVVKQHSITDQELDLCSLPIIWPLKQFLRGAKLKDICVDVFWNHDNCPGPPSNISISYEDCIINIKPKKQKVDYSCVSITVCRILPITELLSIGRNDDEL